MLDQFQLHGYQQEQAWLLLNRATMNGGIRKRDIEERLNVRIKHTVPEDQPLVSYSVNTRRTAGDEQPAQRRGAGAGGFCRHVWQAGG